MPSFHRIFTINQSIAITLHKIIASIYCGLVSNKASFLYWYIKYTYLIVGYFGVLKKYFYFFFASALYIQSFAVSLCIGIDGRTKPIVTLN